MISNIFRFGRTLVTVFFCSALSFAQNDYFQQRVDYKIDVELFDEIRTLKGNLDLTYTNNSPHELNEIYMHLWPNAYRSRLTPLGKQVLENDNTRIPKNEGYIDQLDFKVNGSPVSVEYKDKFEEIAVLKLNTPLKSGQSIQITTPFRVVVPDGSISRLGYTADMDGSIAYMITQWYPKPAVYDINGWHPMPYLSQGEFYSEYGSFDVSITLRSDYVVGATGELQTESEKTFLTQKINKINPTVYSNGNKKTIRYTQDNIHDFAFFANKNFIVQSDTAILDNGKQVVCLAMYTPKNAKYWTYAARMIKKSILYYSNRIGNYPYSYCTAVDGTISAGGGMEYPMVTVIGESEVERTILHEVGHNWFYGQLGSNERIYPWLDEGVNSYFENAYFSDSTQSTQGRGLSFTINQFLSGNSGLDLVHLFLSRHNKHQSLSLPAEQYSYINYGIEVYMHTAAMFKFLESYLGRETFDKAMKHYYSKWEFKHPSPADMHLAFEESTGKDLNWFFNGLMKETQKPDFKTGFKNGEMYVENKFPHALPVKVSYYKGNDLINEVWLEPFSGIAKIKPYEGADKIVVNDKGLWEKEAHNNEIEPNKNCKTCDPVRFSPGLSLPSLTKNYFSVTPLYLWNNYNKSMVGIQFHNKGVIPKRHEFYLAPLLSFNKLSFAGIGDYRYRIWPDKSHIAFMDLGLGYKRFAYDYFEKACNYQKLEFRATGEFKRKFKNKPRRSGMDLRYALLHKQLEPYYSINKIGYGMLQGHYWYENYHRLYPFIVRVGLESKQEFPGGRGNEAVSFKFWAEAKQNVTYWRKKKVQLRAFAAAYTELNSGFIDNRIRLNGWSGTDDYAMEYFYFGRTERPGTFMGNQFIEREGNFKVNAPNGKANVFMVALNLKLDFPIPFFPVGFYTDFGVSGNKGINVGSGTTFNSVDIFSNSGLYLDIYPEVLSIYFPIPQTSTNNLGFVNNDFKNPYFSYVRFSLNLLKLNPTNFKEYVRMIK